MQFRIGHGYDVHQLSAGYALSIGGIQIPHSVGSMGHSDADVLLHALCDALLGALSLGDIGAHFKNTDPRWKGADSKYFLREVRKMIWEKGYAVGNVDATLILEEPKIGKYIPEMKRAIAECLEVDAEVISIKATTSETVGFVGRKEGLEAHAVCLLYKKQ